jgi:glycosyltransferase involved in cell wall biosynthesis
MRVLYLASWMDASTRTLVEQAAESPDVSATLLSDCEKARAQISPRVSCAAFHSGSKVDLSAIRELGRRIVADRIEVVHALSSRFLANALLATHGLSRAPAICGFLGHIGRFSHFNPIHRLTYLHPRLAGVWCNCRAVAAPLLRSGVAAEKIFTIYAGCALGERVSEPGRRVRSELGIADDAVVVGFAGNMRPVKGVDVLLEAALRLADEPSIHWLLLGRVEDRRVGRLATRREIRDRVHLLGWRDDAARLMTAMDLFVMPSRSEGLCRAVMEAMEMGLCPVVTGVGGSPELVRDGVDGLVTPPEDPAALASAIGRLVRDASLRNDLAASARDRIKNAFTMERMVEQTLSMYRSVLEARSVRVARPRERLSPRRIGFGSRAARRAA